jgi:hypothetical protein
MFEKCGRLFLTAKMGRVAVRGFNLRLETSQAR